MNQKLNGDGRERASQVLDLHFKICSLGPKSFFLCPKPPKNLLKTAKRREIMTTLHMQQGFTAPKSPLGPSETTICPRTAPRRPPKAPQFVHIGRGQPQTKNRPYLVLCGSKPDFERNEATRNYPLLVVSTPPNYPQRRLDPRT